MDGFVLIKANKQQNQQMIRPDVQTPAGCHLHAAMALNIEGKTNNKNASSIKISSSHMFPIKS